MYCTVSKTPVVSKSAQIGPKYKRVQAKLRSMKPTRLTFSATTLLISLLMSLPATAQYQWIDANGSRVFSDQPPPASVPNKKILQQPGKAAATTAVSKEADTDSAAKTDKASAPAALAKPAAGKEIVGKDKPVDKELEAKKKQADDAEAAKKKAEMEAQAKAKADNCERAKRAKTSLDSGVRIGTTNAKGEREIMDDAARTVETKRVQGIIQSDCK